MQDILLLGFPPTAASHEWFASSNNEGRGKEIESLASPTTCLWLAGHTGFGTSPNTAIGPSLQFVYKDYETALASFEDIGAHLGFPSGTKLVHVCYVPTTEQREHTNVLLW